MTARNSEDENVPGLDEPDFPGDQAGFDIGWAPVFSARIQGPIEDARKFIDRSRGVIVDRLVNGLAGPAAYADLIRGKMVAPIVEPLQDAAQFADGLAARLLTPIIQTVSDAAGWGRRFGVWPDMGDGSHLPVDVMEARALAGVPELPVPVAPDGLPWVLTPDDFARLQDQYRVEVLPLFGVDTPLYTQKREELESRIPPGSSWSTPWREFTTSAIASAPIVPLKIAPLNFTQSPNVPSLPGGGAGALPPSPTPAAGLIGDPGGFFGYPAGSLACAGIQDSRPPGYATDPDRPRFNSPGVSVSPPDQFEVFKGWPRRTENRDGSVSWSCPIGSRLAYRPSDPNANCVEPGAAACYGPPAGSQVPTFPGTPGTPIPSVPEPPPGDEAPCVKICGLEDLIDALKPDKKPAECPKYKAWRDAESGECYVQPSDREPRHREDKFLVESSNPQAIVDAVNKECGKKPDRRPEEPLQPALGFGRGAAACDWILPPVNADIAGWENPFGWLTGVTGPDGKEPPAADVGGLSLFGQAIARFVRGTIGYGLENVWKVIRGFLANDPCFGGGSAQLAATRTVFNFLQRYFGAALEPAINPLTQHQNFLCPTEMPGPVDAARAYLSNTINEDTARCWIRAAGMRDTLYDRVIRASRSTLNADQIVRLSRRGTIPAGTLQERLRELGFLDQRDYEELWELGRALPGPSDIVRFMVRDVDDQNLVGKFGLDDEFGQKFAGLTAEYAEAAGVDADLMKRFWRAHWSIPSPSQLLEMFHRLRNRPPGDPLRVDLEDIRTAMRQNDVLPYWVDKLLAVSFRPLRQVDVRRAYFDGSIDLDEVRRAYVDGGYSDENADILTRHQAKQKRAAAGRHPAVAAYAAGQINGSELAFEMTDDGFEPDQIEYALARARNRLNRKRRTSCGGAYRRRLLRKELDSIQVTQKLIDLGLDGDQSQLLADAWSCESSAKGKEFTANQLCDLYDRGLVTAGEFVRRLESSGWSRDDAVRIYTVCSQNIDQKRRADEIRAMRQREADAERLARKQEKERQKLERELTKQGREEDRIAKLNDARNRGIIEAGQAWSTRTGTDLSDSITLAKSVYRTVRDNTLATQATILRAVISSSKSKASDTPAAWVSEALTIAGQGTFPDPNNPPVE